MERIEAPAKQSGSLPSQMVLLRRTCGRLGTTATVADRRLGMTDIWERESPPVRRSAADVVGDGMIGA
jgi:hypothetical protein